MKRPTPNFPLRTVGAIRNSVWLWLLAGLLLSACGEQHDSSATLTLQVIPGSVHASVHSAGLVDLNPLDGIDRIRVAVLAGETSVADKSFSPLEGSVRLKVPADTPLTVTASAYAGTAEKYRGTAAVDPIARGHHRSVGFDLNPLGASLRAAPANLQAQALANAVQLTWDAVDQAVAYNIYASPSAGGGISSDRLLATVTGTSYTDQELAPGATRYYVVTAVFADNQESPPTAEQTASLPADTALDSDGDTYFDEHEIAAGTDPHDPASFPPGTSIGPDTNIFADGNTVTWTLAHAPYIVNQYLYLYSGQTLIIEAGVVVKFAAGTGVDIHSGASLRLEGSGAALSKRVILTSINDSSIDGDHNGPNDTPLGAIPPSPADWAGTYFFSASAGAIHFAEYRYGGDYSNGCECSSVPLYLEDNDVAEISNLWMTDNRNGIYVTGRVHAPTISNFHFTNQAGSYGNAIEIYMSSPQFLGSNSIELSSVESSAIRVFGGETDAPRFTNFSITGGRAALDLQTFNTQANSPGSYENFSIDNVADAAIYLHDNVTPTTFSNIKISHVANHGAAIVLYNQLLPAIVRDGLVWGDGVSSKYVRLEGFLGSSDPNMPVALTADPLRNGNSVWLVDSSLSVQNTLSIDAGTIVKFRTAGTQASATLQVGANANLQVNGTADKPVIFTSFLDDAAGQDSNGDGNATTPGANDWQGVNFFAASAGNLNNLQIRFGGMNIDANAAVTQTDVTVANPP